MMSRIATRTPRLPGSAPMAAVVRPMSNISQATQGGSKPVLRGIQALHKKPMLASLGRLAQARAEAKGDAAKAAFLAARGATYDQEMAPEDTAAVLQAASQNFQAAHPDAVSTQQAMQAQAMQQDSLAPQASDGESYDGGDAGDAEAAPQAITEEVPGEDWESDVPWLEEQGFAGDGPLEHDERNPLRAVSYLENGRLCTIGVCRTPMGPVAVTDVRPAAGHGKTRMGSDGHPAKSSLYAKATDAAMRREAASYVYRARQGDQNAMAMLQAVGQNAAKGNARAQAASEHIRAELARQPLPAPQRINGDDQDLFGAEAHRNQGRADTSQLEIVELADGPELSNEAILRLAASFGDDGESHAFLEGVKQCTRIPPMHGEDLDFESQLIQLGRKVGLARKLQYARQPHTPITPAFPDVGWEFGE